ncbi:hypothetical protein [Burkholderia ubonensis]|uniref:hypothetical protein n=1 Tax=Burkholderia ubonensis TaxID=101571 RepID=UPI000AD8955F|nr:hypothetical protein [Burkholderia ubonensis]
MATRMRKTNPVYATATATVNRDYGHITIHVYELMPYRGGTLKISCQSGGSSRDETYAWEHGVSNDYSVLGMDALKKGYWLMRKVSRQLEKDREELGSPRNFAEYAVRVLRAAGVRKIHLLPGVNPGYVGDVQTLPSLDPRKQGDLLTENLRCMEEKILEMATYREAV